MDKLSGKGFTWHGTNSVFKIILEKNWNIWVNVSGTVIQSFNRVKNIMRKGEIAHYEQILLYPHCFYMCISQKATPCRWHLKLLKKVIFFQFGKVLKSVSSAGLRIQPEDVKFGETCVGFSRSGWSVIIPAQKIGEVHHTWEDLKVLNRITMEISQQQNTSYLFEVCFNSFQQYFSYITVFPVLPALLIMIKMHSS